MPIIKKIATISLTQGKFAIVDSITHEYLSQFKWTYEKGYAIRKVQKNCISRAIYMHRLVVGAPDGLEVDHINGDRLDNRKDNLRICTHEQNCHNTRIQSNNTSGFKGVSWKKDKRRWKSYINPGRKQMHIGYFKTKEEAALAYNEYAKKLFGNFARLNIV